MKNILIPTDFSENSWNAIAYAIHFFKESSCHFYLLHVNRRNASGSVETLKYQKQNAVLEPSAKSSKKLLEETLDRINGCFPKNPRHRFFTILDHNYFISSIREQVAQKRIDFIVMGTKGASSYKKNSIGTNTGNVITKVKCTTLVVPENALFTPPKEIAFPTDFSIFYRPETLQPLLDVVDVSHAKVHILHAHKFEVKLNEDQQKNRDLLDDYFNNYEHQFHFLANNSIEEAIQGFVDLKDINLIAMLAKNLNYFQKILFQPTLKEMDYYRKVPFLILH